MFRIRRLALDGLVSFTALPLRVSSVLGALFAPGVVGEYLGRACDKVKARPLHVVSARPGFESQADG